MRPPDRAPDDAGAEQHSFVNIEVVVKQLLHSELKTREQATHFVENSSHTTARDLTSAAMVTAMRRLATATMTRMK